MKRHYGHSTLEVSSARTKSMNQPVATLMRDDYVVEDKQPIGVPARTRQVLAPVHLYIAIYS